MTDLAEHSLELGALVALDAAADTAGVSPELLKVHRTRVLTSERPDEARRLLADAYDDFAWRAAA